MFKQDGEQLGHTIQIHFIVRSQPYFSHSLSKWLLSPQFPQAITPEEAKEQIWSCLRVRIAQGSVGTSTAKGLLSKTVPHPNHHELLQAEWPGQPTLFHAPRQTSGTKEKPGCFIAP